jgi:predicted nucleic acid binding AN1-type Zn finger protein
VEVKVIELFCRYCGKEIDQHLPFKCKQCSDQYCIDHLSPEKHKCPYLTPEQWKDYQPIQTVIPEEPIKISEPLQDFDTCAYCLPRGDGTKKKIIQCPYCNEWFCEGHALPKKPMPPPFRTTNVEERIEWGKKGHPCIPYYDVKRGEEKFSNVSYQPYGSIPIRFTPTSYPTPKPPTMPLPKPSSGKKIKQKNTKPLGLSYKIAGGVLIILLIISIFYCYNTAMEINSRSSYLEMANINLNTYNNELNGAITKLNSDESVLHNLENNLISVKNKVSTTELNLNDVDSELAYLRTGGKYTLHDPTYSEVLNFLAGDSTDSNKYNNLSYTCAYFSTDVNNNAERQGIRCAYVVLSYPSVSHAIVAFNTIDSGLVYFEPQYDVRADVVIGQRFYQCLQDRPGWIWNEPSYDDTIQGITCY